MAAIAEGKYQLRSLHEEIDLYDRKLTHLLKYESFATDSTRDAAAKKLKNRRDLLAKTARRLAADGVEFQQRELPRSFVLEDAHEAEPAEPAELADTAETASTAPAAPKTRKAAVKSSNPAAAPMPEVLPPSAETPMQSSLDS